MIPLPQVTELDELPPEFSAEELWPGLGERPVVAGEQLDHRLDQRDSGKRLRD